MSQLLAALSAGHSETEVFLSSITVMELEHGWHRANTPEAAAKRRCYLDEADHPARRAVHKRDGRARREDRCGHEEGRSNDRHADLLIGITALHFDQVSGGYAIGTRNGRHFRMIPGLNVLSL